MRFKLLAVLALSCALIAPIASTPPPASAADCQFTLGFKTLHDLIPNVVGDCVGDATYTANGDAFQQTTRGFLFWRKADNLTAFTDGRNVWVSGPGGAQEQVLLKSKPTKTAKHLNRGRKNRVPPGLLRKQGKPHPMGRPAKNASDQNESDDAD